MGKGRVSGKGLRSAVVLSLFILLVGCAAFFPPAVSAVEKTVGVIIPDIPFYRDIHNSFMARLSREDHGGRVEVITQRPYPDPISLSNAARKLIALDVDVIVAYGAPAALAAYREKTKIPVVYAVVYEPIASKIKAKNVTGVTSRVSISSLLRYLRGMSAITSLGVIYSSNEEDSLYQLKEVQNLSNQYGFKVEEINLKRPQDAQAALSGRKVDAIFVTGSSVASMTSSTIMEYAGEHRIPTASMIPAKSPPAIITLSSGPKDQGEKAADMVMKILGGVAPEKIKADSSGDVELVFNLREAKERGYKIPMDLITESTRLIQ